jgi:hypothetical protein
MRMVLNRMGSLVEMDSVATTREDEAGRLLGAEMTLVMSEQSTTTRAVVEPGRVLLTSGVGDASFENEQPYEGELIGPAGARALIRNRLRKVGDRITYSTYRAEIGQVVEVTLERTGSKTRVVAGEPVELSEVVETFEGMALTTTHLVDASGRSIHYASPGPFGEMETVLADAAAAKMATSGNSLSEESYGASLLHTQVRLPEPRRSSRIVLELRHRNPALGWPDLSASNQTVLSQTEDRLSLEVRRMTPGTKATFPVQPTADTGDLLEANAYIQSDDPEVRALAREIVGETNDIYTAAKKLERWVAENMTFDMGVVLAPSSEVLVNRRGTCTEYAVLLTTLVRSLGIPARFTMGYVYVGGIYGGHAWTETLIGEEWVGFDGAVPSEGPVAADRIAFSWDSMAEGLGRITAGPALQLYGQVDVSVLEYAVEGEANRTYSADENAIAIQGDEYRNSSLGVAWTKPPASKFVDLDVTWPETTLVGIEGPGGNKATLGVRDRRYWSTEEEAAREALDGLIEDGTPEAPRLQAGALTSCPPMTRRR